MTTPVEPAHIIEINIGHINFRFFSQSVGRKGFGGSEFQGSSVRFLMILSMDFSIYSSLQSTWCGHGIFPAKGSQPFKIRTLTQPQTAGNALVFPVTRTLEVST